jgi:hypothetical protein
MAKLKLAVETLRVETFDAGGALHARGTVEALSPTDVTQVLTGACCTHVAATCCTRINTGCNPDVTQVHTAGCCPPG